MKKSHKILLALALLAAAAAVIVISNLPIAKTQEAVGELLRKKLDLPQDTVITCAGDYTADADTLLWFIIQNQDMTLYRAVDCRVLNNGSYWMKKDIHAQRIRAGHRARCMAVCTRYYSHQQFRLPLDRVSYLLRRREDRAFG